jgi:hypothetical protein
VLATDIDFHPSLLFSGEAGGYQVSISPTFSELHLRQNPFANITNPNCKHIKAAQKLSYLKAARKILVKLTLGWSPLMEIRLTAYP